jgi:hypothetical protein
MTLRIVGWLFLVGGPAAVFAWWQLVPVSTLGAVAAGLLFFILGVQAFAVADLIQTVRKKRASGG